jgi:Xaa-Pro aminopeptidase
VLTVEPGVYLPPHDEQVPPEYRGIGVRIEDDVAVTEEGHRVLTHDIPKDAATLEALLTRAASAA